jgi:dolichol-phosphate mannosyltransferase
MKNKILVFTATYNEKDSIVHFLLRLYKYNKYNFDLLIIDDNSPDMTYEVIRKFKLKTKKKITLKIRKKKMGLDTAYKYAFNYAKKKNFKYFITLDADLSHDPKKINSFLEELKKYPVVLGSRYISGGRNNLKGYRFFISYLGNKFIKFLFSAQLSEFTTSFRGFDLHKIKIDFNKVQSKGYSFFMEIVYLLIKLNYKIKEIPIIFKVRRHGVSKIDKIELLRTFFNAFRLYINKIYY